MNWQQVREVFEAALDQSSPQEWLERQVLDSAVRSEVASLLDHHSRAGSFLVDAIAEQEKTGFSYDRPKGKNHCVMRRTVSPVKKPRRARVG